MESEEEEQRTMSCYCDIEPMKSPEDTLKHLCQQAANKVNRIEGLTERERGLLVCVLGIRGFGWALRDAMDESGQVFAGFSDDLVPDVVLIPGDEIWSLIDDLTECILDGTGDLERFDPDAAEGRRMIQSHLRDLEETHRLTDGLPPVDVQGGPYSTQ